MKKRILTTFVNLGFLSSLLMLVPQGVKAQASSSFLPKQIKEIFDTLGAGGSGAAPFITGRVRTGLFVALGLLILVAVVYALLAAFKYIQSQGDPGKIEEAQKAIKAIFYGIAAMMIGIVGIVLVFVFFGNSYVDPTLAQVCISAPNSKGCGSCKGDVTDNQALCKTCEKAFATAAAVVNGSGAVTDVNCKDPVDGGTVWP